LHLPSPATLHTTLAFPTRRSSDLPDLIDITAMRIPFGNGTLGARKATLDRQPEIAERVLRATAQATSRFKTDPAYAVARSTRSADRKSTRLNSSHDQNSYAVFCLK